MTLRSSCWKFKKKAKKNCLLEPVPVVAKYSTKGFQRREWYKNWVNELHVKSEDKDWGDRCFFGSLLHVGNISLFKKTTETKRQTQENHSQEMGRARFKFELSCAETRVLGLPIHFPYEGLVHPTTLSTCAANRRHYFFNKRELPRYVHCMWPWISADPSLRGSAPRSLVCVCLVPDHTPAGVRVFRKRSFSTCCATFRHFFYLLFRTNLDVVRVFRKRFAKGSRSWRF